MTNFNLNNYFDTSASVILSVKNETSKVKEIAKLIYNSSLTDGKVLIAGNGGSSADAEHFAGELVCTFKSRDRKPFPAMSLSNNPAAITAWSNDFAFNTYFSRQVEALGTKNDILFLITTGGGNRDNGASMNLVYAAEQAKEIGLKVITLAGKGGGILKNISDVCITIDSFETANIQEAHIVLIHSICYILEDLSTEKY